MVGTVTGTVTSGAGTRPLDGIIVASLADELSEKEIRVDVDDRSESVQKKIHGSEIEWIPFTVVVGRRELKEKKLAVRFRGTGKVKNMKSGKLADMIKKETSGMPFKRLSLPRLLSKRPTFIG